MWTPEYPWVLRWHHSNKASFADFFSDDSLSSSWNAMGDFYQLGDLGEERKERKREN